MLLDGVEEISLVIFNDIFKIMLEEFSKPAKSRNKKVLAEELKISHTLHCK